MVQPAQQNQEDEDGEEEEEGDEDGDQEETARCEWDFHLSSSIVSPGVGGRAVSDTLGVVEFDPSDQFIATGGIARKIRIYSLSSLLPDDDYGSGGAALLDHSRACSFYLCTPAKLSSLRWRPDSFGRVLGAGDYDGVVTEYDLVQRVVVSERDEHGGRRVWSVDYSRSSPPLGASGSADGTAQLWDTRCGGGCVANLRPSGGGAGCSPICCVEFDPYGGAAVALGSTDCCAYVYDVRRAASPIRVLYGHQKTVTYVKFAAENYLASAAIDGCIKLWSIVDAEIVRTYRGHLNSRSFVGLSVWRGGGLLGCGSEDGRVFVYDRRWGDPIWVRGFDAQPQARCDQRFVSSMCWTQAGEDDCTLVAGGSDGALQVFTGKRKPDNPG